MLTSIRVTRGVNVLDLPLDDSAESFYVTDITGLGTKQNILMDDSFYIPGSNYIGRSPTLRNIVIKLAHKNLHVSLSDRRRELAKYFAPGSNILIELHSDNHPTMQTVGSVETVDTELFVKDPAIVISILCQPVPFFAMDYTTIPNFSASATAKTINYEGTTPTGFSFKFTPWDALIKITRVGTSEVFFQDNLSDNPVVDFPYGRLSTVPGNRYFKSYTPGGSSYNAPECVTAASTWHLLYPGPNVFTFVSTAGKATTFSEFQWTTRYEGV